MGRKGRMSKAIVETGCNLSWIEVNERLRIYDEGLPFEMPATYEAAS
jgi:hypothetical protein